VLVDDLVTREHREPYRMFTSAAEHRLLLRAENADERLSEIGFGLGLLSRVQLERVREKLAAIAAEERRLAAVTVAMPAAGGTDDEPSAAGTDGEPAAAPPGRGPARRAARTGTALDVLAQAGASYAGLRALGVDTPLRAAWAECLEVRARYRGYIERQQRAAERAAEMDGVELPDAIWAEELRALSREAREKLTRMRPGTLGQAARIAGVSPADVAVLMIHARRFVGDGAAAAGSDRGVARV
jgi:tRNA uridine 5-carboxymethylaminomethyl modification enzyme